jgi:uncharacterized membrane protein
MAGGVRYISAGPLSVLAILLFIVFILLLIPLLVLGIIGAAFTRLGLSWVAALALVLLMLAGSFVNIPVYRIRRDLIRALPMEGSGGADPFAFPPVWDTVISVNLGGGILPVCVAVYLVYQAVTVTSTNLLFPVGLCAFLVMAISYVSTHPITGKGIRIPALVPSLTAILAGVLLSGGTGLAAAVTAFAGGTFGTLAGGNLAHLHQVRDLEVPEVSVGGFGSFGAVFLCCILPALIT